uniref:Uncharacterized protein n=1 Tax=Octopus bimaculoides TaxID=37653 RepID=A0A0L8FUQ7_OCTBM
MRNVTVDELNASIKHSVLRHHVKTLQLSTNMRSRLSRHQPAELFAEQLLKFDEGRLPIDEEQFLTLNPMCNSTHSIDDLVAEIFPNFLHNYNNTDWICEQAILDPKNVAVHSINNRLLNKLPGEIFTYNSTDSIVDDRDSVNYPIKFLNLLEPPAEKKMTPIVLLCNLSQPKLCNGTRLIVHKLVRNCIEANILTGCGEGVTVFIPHIPVIPFNVPFQFKCINKSQGQALKVAGLQLQEPYFSHGQLCVGASCVGAKANLFAYAPQNKTKNIVYKEIFTLNAT